MTFDLILIALAIALDPLPLTAFILVLGTPGGTRTGAGFLAGWLVSLVAIVVLSLLLTGGNPPRADTIPSQAALLVRILAGIALLIIAWTRHRTRGQPRPTPRWMSRVNRLNAASAAALAFLLQPWGLIAAGAATVTQADMSEAAAVLSVVLYCVLATLSYFLMEAYAILSPEASRSRLQNFRDWIDRHRDPAIVTGSLILGLWLISKSIYLLAG